MRSSDLDGTDAFGLVLDKLCEAYADRIRDRDARHEAEQSAHDARRDRDNARTSAQADLAQFTRDKIAIAEMLVDLQKRLVELNVWGEPAGKEDIGERLRERLINFIAAETPF